MSAKPNFYGVYPPTITCFDKNGDFAWEKQRNVISFLLEKGVHGLWILGSYGSFPLLTKEERKKVTEMIIDEVNGRIPIIAHIGSASSKETVELAKHAQSAGATAVASVTPYYYSSFAYTEEQIVQHFKAVVDSVDIPVFLYNNPRTTGYNVSAELLKKLANVGVKGIKDSSGNFVQIAEYIMHVQPDYTDFAFFTGTAALLMPSLMLEAQGGVAGTANAFPEIVVDVYELYKQGKYEEAAKRQNLVLKVRDLQGIDGFRPASCYAMLRMRGIDAGTVRSPWKEMPKDKYEHTYQELNKLGVI